jgi:hypothetical protein
MDLFLEIYIPYSLWRECNINLHEGAHRGVREGVHGDKLKHTEKERKLMFMLANGVVFCLGKRKKREHVASELPLLLLSWDLDMLGLKLF